MFYKYAGSQEKCLNDGHIAGGGRWWWGGGGGKLSHPLGYPAFK